MDADITASGGIADITDIEKLAAMGMYGAICGKSIYAGTLDLAAAIKAAGTMRISCAAASSPVWTSGRAAWSRA